MNLLANPCFQIAQRGKSFNLVNPASFTLDRWVSIANGEGRINIKQVEAPLGCEIEFNSAGYGGIWQSIERDQVKAEVGRLKKIAVNARSSSAGSMWLGVLVWSGTVDKPSLAPIGVFGSSPTLNAGWSLLDSATFTVGTADDRYTLDVSALPDSPNIAFAAVFDGEASQSYTVRDVTFDRTADYDGYNYSDEFARNAWFSFKFTYEHIMNAEMGIGRKDPGGFISFQLPLPYPMRGRLGGAGKQDIKITWPVGNDGFWQYGAGGVVEFPISTTGPTFTCHHRDFLLFTIPAGASIANYNPSVWRHWWAQTDAFIFVDAELRP